MERIHLFVSGLVQGVGFRAAARREATRLGLHGWVKNTRDGRVEVVAEGGPAPLDSFIEWCKRGPVGSNVSQVDLLERAPAEKPAYSSFEIV